MPQWSSLIREKMSDLSADPVREAEIVQEIAHHLEDRYQEALQSGCSHAEAIERALSELRQAAAAGVEFRRADRPRPMAPKPPPPGQGPIRSVMQDVVYAFRLLRRNPTFSLFSVLILALGIAAATSIFTVVNTVLLRPLPYPNGEQLALVGHATSEGRAGTLGFATLQDWKEQSRSFSHLALLRSWLPTLRDDRGAHRLNGVRVSAEYFSALGATPALGRDFRSEEDRPGHGRVVILSDSLWRNRFGGDLKIVGRSMVLNGRSYEIIGVMGPDFQDIPSSHIYQAPAIWAPLAYDDTLPWACRGCQHLRALGRLKPDFGLTAAQTELSSIHSQLKKQHPADYAAEDRAAVVSLHEEITRAIRPALKVLTGAVLLVLLVGCANVANMLFARTVQRRKEMSLRSALGAGGLRLLRQLLTENLLLGLAGGLLGLLLSAALVRLLLVFAPAELVRIGPLQMDFRVMLFAPALAVLTGILYGLAPAAASAGGDLMASLRQDTRVTAVPGVRRVQRLLVVADLALAMVLLTGSLLMLQSVRNLLQVNPGFDAADVLTAGISMVGDRYEEDSAVVTATEDILMRLSAMPGVAGAAAASQVPQGGNWDAWGVHRQDRLEANPSEAPFAQLYVVTAGYFRLLGIPLRNGRLFEATDRAGSVPVMIVSQETADRLWPGEDPIGKRVRVGGSEEGPWWTVVGTVGDVLHAGLDSPPGLQMYLPLPQRPHPFPILVLKTGMDHEGLALQIKNSVAEVSSDIPVYDLATLESRLAAASSDRRFVTLLLSAFAVLAVLLTAAGIYGLASHIVIQRTHELAVRVALGAGLARVAGLVLGQGARLTMLGVLCGLALALGLTRFMERLLFGVEPLDPWTMTLCGAILLLVVGAAHSLPVKRALEIDPARALRAE